MKAKSVDLIQIMAGHEMSLADFLELRHFHGALLTGIGAAGAEGAA